MEMQDKEFDDLFHSKLDNFEIEPSAHVWHGIAGELAAGRRKRSLLPFLSIAASVVVLVTAGVLFIPQKVSLPVKHNINNKTGPAPIQPSTNGLVVIKQKPAVLVSKRTGRPNTAIIARLNVAPTAKATGQALAAVNSQATQTVDTANTGNAESLATLTQKQGVITAMAPDSNTQIVVKNSMQISPSFITKPAIADVQLPTAEKQSFLPVKSSRKVHSIGHFINSVVAKIDKRQDKVIEFTDIDDEGSVLTGVNLGFVKIKKEK